MKEKRILPVPEQCVIGKASSHYVNISIIELQSLRSWNSTNDWTQWMGGFLSRRHYFSFDSTGILIASEKFHSKIWFGKCLIVQHNIFGRKILWIPFLTSSRNDIFWTEQIFQKPNLLTSLYWSLEKNCWNFVVSIQNRTSLNSILLPQINDVHSSTRKSIENKMIQNYKPRLQTLE